jgi:hypothetical protein
VCRGWGGLGRGLGLGLGLGLGVGVGVGLGGLVARTRVTTSRWGWDLGLRSRQGLGRVYEREGIAS